ncbi:E3 ubiquitin-protein ligase TRIM33-like isoform X2 [Mercenaria mercenaria]|uniref:E3 ubiquitin-protein ligase TRIM33-like isoform X2 n=1 Tax=Mercenaria mercenaria TaxID=6596 RepID=UPI00234E68B7|nr:E3 ubiquitin-protein ligase TRIM33-like isoform X2 [Mercenaria mercenaria]
MEVSGRKADQDRSVASGKIYHFCEPCQDEQVMTRANGLCRECKEYMCNTCFQHHLKARQCRNHVFLDASDQSASSHEGDGKAVKCKFHKNETIKYYCRKHDIVGCGDCMVLGHGACKPEFVKDLVKDFQENGVFRRFVGKLENLTSAIAESEKKIQDDMRENKTMYEIALKEIIKFRADINEYLDKAETDVITEVNRFKSENENLLVKLEKNCKELSCKIGKVKQVINAENCRGTSLFIHSVECKPDVLDIERALAQLKLKNNIEKITFVPDKQLFNIVASKTKLGEMAVPAFADVKQLSHATIDKTPDEKIQRKQLSETKEERWRNCFRNVLSSERDRVSVYLPE